MVCGRGRGFAQQALPHSPCTWHRCVRPSARQSGLQSAALLAAFLTARQCSAGNGGIDMTTVFEAGGINRFQRFIIKPVPGGRQGFVQTAQAAADAHVAPRFFPLPRPQGGAGASSAARPSPLPALSAARKAPWTRPAPSSWPSPAPTTAPRPASRSWQWRALAGRRGCWRAPGRGSSSSAARRAGGRATQAAGRGLRTGRRGCVALQACGCRAHAFNCSTVLQARTKAGCSTQYLGIKNADCEQPFTQAGSAAAKLFTKTNPNAKTKWRVQSQ